MRICMYNHQNLRFAGGCVEVDFEVLLFHYKKPTYGNKTTKYQ